MITLTENAALRVTDSLKERGHGLGIRFGVKGAGCSGVQYVIEYVDDLEEGDVTFEDKGVTIVVDPKSLIYIDGSEIDFAKTLMSEGFEFNNPNSKGACGCGESFTI